MRPFHSGFRATLAGVSIGALIALSGCDGERKAEADTPVSEAEVRTELPESVVSDDQLQTSAEVAADIAASPPPEVEIVPVPVGNGAAAADGAARPNSATNNPATTNTTGQ